MHVHEDDDESHDTCPDCGSGDPMRLCEDCLFYAGQDAR